jgi:hypothetical protein
VERYLLIPNPVTNCDFVESNVAGYAKGSMSPERRRAMVAKKGKTTKKMKDLGARKVTSAQAKKVKGGMGAGGGGGSGKVGWVKV